MIAGIGLSGKAGSGKSSLAEAIVYELVRRGYKTASLSLSDAIRETMVEQYGHVPRGTEQYRRLMVRVGDQGRHDDPVHWVRVVSATVLRCLDEHRVFVIDDIRTYPEAVTLENLGCTIVRVEASTGVRRERLRLRGENEGFAESLTESEIDLDGYAFHQTVRSRRRHGERELRDLAREIVWKAEDPRF